MLQNLEVLPFLQAPGPILDVRSPGEYTKAHIPGALNLPLFTDGERAAIGTSYKQEGREQALDLGLQIVGPKLYPWVAEAKHLAPDRQVRVHCWRGGMRSGSVAQLLATVDFQVSVLMGGYQAFRRWGRSLLAESRPIQILGGMTGTGKTDILQALARQGEQVLDLEALAHHRGSSYGNLLLPEQPSTEHFENHITMAWWSFSPHRPVWIEAESHQVGRCRIPDELYQQMERANILEIWRSPEERIALLTAAYSPADRQDLITATERIRKRLGGQRTQVALDAIAQGDAHRAIAIVLDYYDRAYRHDLERRPVHRETLNVTGLSAEAAADHLLQHLVANTKDRNHFPHHNSSFPG